MSQAVPRPSAVSSACLFIGLSSGLLLIQIMGWLTSWNSLQQQEIIAEVGESLQLTDTTALATTLRITLMVMVILLVTGGVGAVYAARGHQMSRIMISVVGVVVALLFVFSGSLIGLIPGAFAIGSVIRLWSGDATRWFAERNGKTEPATSPTALTPDATYPQPPPPPPGAVGPAALSAVPANPPIPRRPSSVDTAALVAVLASFVAVGCAIVYLVIYAVFPQERLIEIQQESPIYQRMNTTEADLIRAYDLMAGLAVVTIVLSVLALAAAFALSRGKTWGSRMLFALSVITIVLGVLTIIGIPWGGFAIWVLVLLQRASTRTWLNEVKTTH